MTASGSVAFVGLAGCVSGGKPPDYSAWEDLREFSLEGRAMAWKGVEPAIIDGEDNPTIVLVEGEAYDFRWVNEDSAIHNLEIRDGNGDVVDDYATESVDTQGEGAALENVIASREMTAYVCKYHQGTQAGEIEVIAP